MKLKFYEAFHDDMREVAFIYNEFLGSLRDLTADEYFDFKDLDVEKREGLLKERMAKKQGKVLLVKDEDLKGKIVAFISFSVIDCFLIVSSVKQIGYIDGAYVKEAYRGKGILRELEKMALASLREMGIKYLELNTLAKNIIANEAWKKLGYRVFRQQWRKRINE